LVATLGGMLFGYDTGVISGAIGLLTAKFHLSDAMEGWASGCVLLGCAAGVLSVGGISDRFGRKRALFLAAILFLVSAIGTAVPHTIFTFVIFRVVGGLGIGIASISTPMYIAEITPGHVRGRLVAANQIAIVGGIAMVYFINYFIARHGDHAWNIEYGWRWMFASGILPSVLFFCCIKAATALLSKALNRQSLAMGMSVTGFVDPEAHNILFSSATTALGTVGLQKLYDEAGELPVFLGNDMHACAARWMLTHRPGASGESRMP
jgi:MFS family permease